MCGSCECQMEEAALLVDDVYFDFFLETKWAPRGKDWPSSSSRRL